MFWDMLARSGSGSSSPWSLFAAPAPAPAPEPAKPHVGRPARGDRAQVKAARKAARRGRRR